MHIRIFFIYHILYYGSHVYFTSMYLFGLFANPTYISILEPLHQSLHIKRLQIRLQNTKRFLIKILNLIFKFYKTIIDVLINFELNTSNSKTYNKSIAA